MRMRWPARAAGAFQLELTTQLAADAGFPPLPPAEIPGWATFEPNVEVWYAFLNQLGCDEFAIQDLFALAQVSKSGRELANAVIHKLLKKLQDNEELRKPSAFVHVCVKNARHLLHGDLMWR